MQPEQMCQTGADEEKPSAWGPLSRSVFRSLWIATVVSNIGTWMQNTASAWLMTSLAPSPIMVALVQTATSLPLFLLALPAGSLADVLDRRRLLICTQLWMLFAAAALGFLTFAEMTTPWVLLAFTLMLSLGAALNAPAWQAIVPELVSRSQIPAAVALNSAGFNVARSVGPALGGLVLGIAGAGAAFLLNAASFVGVVIVLFRWRQSPRESTLPAERVLAAIRTGIRFARHAPALRAVLFRSASFMISASALMALLPLLARGELALGSTGYGLLLGFFGFGAVIGAVMLQGIRRRISIDYLVSIGTICFAATLTILAFVQNFEIVCLSLAIGGAAWLAILASFNSGVQSVVPSWVRGRSLSIYMLVLFGSMAGGSALWGMIAGFVGIPVAMASAAGVLLASQLITARYTLAAVESLDLSPSMHWPAPHVVIEPDLEEGPVLIMIEYFIDPARSDEFSSVMRRRGNARLRDGAIRWGLFVDAAKPDRYIESFIVDSWVEHLRQHERVTVADRELEVIIHDFHVKREQPVVTHLLAKALPK